MDFSQFILFLFPPVDESHFHEALKSPLADEKVSRTIAGVLAEERAGGFSEMMWRTGAEEM